jgi:uncharacterized protein YodC (DUF2158 family)
MTKDTYIRRLAEAFSAGDMRLWQSASEKERAEAHQYIQLSDTPADKPSRIMPQAEKKSSKITVGDIVHLRSGGPHMTVSLIRAGRVHCMWFDGQGIARTSFPMGALTKVAR